VKRRDDYERRRPTAHERGYDGAWQQAARHYLQGHPLCVIHLREGRLVRATQVDHIRAHRGDYELFWDERNWQGLCQRCHSRKTATEDGGFGRRVSEPASKPMSEPVSE